MKISKKALGLALGSFVLTGGLFAETAMAKSLKASHQWPGGKGDVRDEMVQIIAREVNAANVGLDIKVYPGKALFKPKEQWGAMVKGQLDISAFPLAYAAGRHPEFNATNMPGLVKNHDHATRLNKSPFMDDIKKIIDDAGVVVLADAWLAGGFASKKQCILGPDTMKGQVTRAAGKSFEQMLVGAGASIASMPSSEIYSAMQTGVLDAANTSSGSFVSYRIYEQVKCLTAPGDNALWFMYEPLLMSKKSWNKLNKEQQDALMAAGKKSEDFFLDAAKGLDTKLVEAYEGAGVEVVTMSNEDAAAWLEIAKETSYKAFAEKVKGGEELINKALAVE
ncbi:ABC transporter substrate-binding protein [Kiloniella litopenaei]|uniref:ABC transporter substrate-binding protein n=1 Tax=Kiloniella litopenaei TaxID=1549748 RepID=A0A0M2R9S0_9PROT|nr:TRAP transporter substrate-binding protein DctP [Kiloniella litopenaei]KKJ78592.1 ABC transporter substrate-binding protein [Kiloniella litopenaei]